ncbi:hypothetical protein [Streptomyces sp. NPDC006285]|uniref:hypothetical protein n=1 Tax=Streptomyces sp. NPDC006285 TaxID=3364742 RepID=UPI0036A91F63
MEDFDVIGFLQQMTVRCQELLMRRHAQDHRMLLSDVARDVIANGSALPAPPGRSEANPADAE